MDSFVPLHFPTGDIRFDGTVRGGDDSGHMVYRIVLPNQSALYGEWDLAWVEKGPGFNAVIKSFGFFDARNVNNPNLDARKRFSSEEIMIIKDLIVKLFENEEAKAGLYPFSVKSASYLGGVTFLDDWILETTNSIAPVN